MSLRKVLLIATVIVALCSCSKQEKKIKRQTPNRETNAVNFIRLAVMRLIYGVASRFGFQENISEAFDGAFVPPGVDDDYDFDQIIRDYDY
ncbi:hypothetical protein FQR65_LT10795 [Abscondita terminalis]|nr:hypothetical protein FQR65_LT10795 [Abscondita terminalis]